MKKTIAILFALLVSAGTYAYEAHKIWDQLLQNFVSESGGVNYEAFKANQDELEGYLSLLSQQTPDKTWSREKTMAYWINAYNAFTIKLMLESYPVKSIMEVNGGKAWDLEFIELGGKTYSLNNIEHDILRKNFKDPRIHFAVNCASISCPKLHNKAFTEENLESLLEELSGKFINNEAKNTLSSNAIEISKLFEWYANDFKKDGTLIDFLNKYAAVKISASATISYKEYNWNLNNSIE